MTNSTPTTHGTKSIVAQKQQQHFAKALAGNASLPMAYLSRHRFFPWIMPTP
jgi:hypothetical protein